MGSTTDEDGHATTYAYDAAGGKISVTVALGYATGYGYKTLRQAFEVHQAASAAV